jgi:hypothetical protein
VLPVNGNGLQVLVVDDSAMVRQVMQAIMSTDRRINVKAAADPLIAWGKMQKEPPHVVFPADIARERIQTPERCPLFGGLLSPAGEFFTPGKNLVKETLEALLESHVLSFGRFRSLGFRIHLRFGCGCGTCSHTDSLL